MKHKYNQYIKKMFKHKFKEKFPDFKYWKSTKQQGLDYNFVNTDQNSWKMISIQNEKYDNAFSIEIFWSQKEEAVLYESTLFSNLEFDTPINLDDKQWLSLDRVRVRLVNFWAKDFETWWAIDTRGEILDSINRFGYITSEAYYNFLENSIDNFDQNELTNEQMSIYIDILVNNAIDMIGKYSIPFFDFLDKSYLGKK